MHSDYNSLPHQGNNSIFYCCIAAIASGWQVHSTCGYAPNDDLFGTTGVTTAICGTLFFAQCIERDMLRQTSCVG